MKKTRLIAGLLPFALFAFLVTAANATSLVMVDQAGCPFCVKFHREVEPSYFKRAEGKRAPLRRVDVTGSWPQDLGKITPVKFTPVFILVKQGREVGRIFGYSDPKSFWINLNTLLSKTS